MKAQRSRAEQNKILTIRRVYQAVVDAVNQTPQGAPGEPLFAVVGAYMSRAEFDRMMASLVYANRIRRDGDRYFPAAVE